MTNEEIEELKGLAASMGLYDDKNPCKRALILGKAIKALEQQTCEDAVSREAVLGLFAQNADAVRPYSKTWEEVKALPPVTPQQKMGHWIFDEILDKHYYCSECKSMGVDYWDFCPNCGARMIEPQERSGKK